MDSLKLALAVTLLILFADPFSIPNADEPADEDKLVFKVEAHEKGALLYFGDDKILFEGVPWEGCSEIPDFYLDFFKLSWADRRINVSGELAVTLSGGKSLRMEWNDATAAVCTVGDLTFILLDGDKKIKYGECIAPLDGPTNWIFKKDGTVAPMNVDLEALAAANPGNNGVLVLDGNSALRVNMSKSLRGLEAFTLECWASRNAPPGSESAVIGKTENSAYSIFWTALTPSGCVYLKDHGFLYTGAPENKDWSEWSHLALSYDRTKLRFFVDGKPAGESEHPGMITDNDLPLYIGAEPDANGNAVSFFQGAIDEVRMSDIARYTEAFIPANVHKRDGNTLLLLHLDAEAQGIYPDDSGHGNHGWSVGRTKLVRNGREDPPTMIAAAPQTLRQVADSELKTSQTVFPDWEKYAVPQRRLDTGCIPTGYEILLRAAGVEGIDFTTFQEEFDLGTARNNFGNVAEAVNKKYPNIRISTCVFKTGEEKLRFVEDRLAKGQPTLISLAMSQNGGWHIMPVVDHNEKELFLLYMVAPNGGKDLRAIHKSEFIRRHNEWPGGNDVAFLKKDSIETPGKVPAESKK